MQLLIIGAAALYLFAGMRRAVFLAALAITLAYLAMRGNALGRLPLVGPHDTLLFFSASIGMMAVPFLYGKTLNEPERLAWPVAFVAALTALLALLFPVRNMPLPGILSTLWFELHVALAFFAYALFAIGAVTAFFHLRSGERAFLDLTSRAALVGFTFFSLSMITGGIWGYYAWGTYWLWTPKELWTSILWLWYAAWLHLRYRGPAPERLMAWGAIVGLAVTLFTYLGVSLLLKSSHSF